jgi:hypothetical protein
MDVRGDAIAGTAPKKATARTPGRTRLLPLPAVEPVASLLVSLAQEEGEASISPAFAQRNGEKSGTAGRSYSAGKAVSAALLANDAGETETLPGSVPPAEPQSPRLSNLRGQPTLLGAQTNQPDEQPFREIPVSESAQEAATGQSAPKPTTTWRERADAGKWSSRKDSLLWAEQDDDNMEQTAYLEMPVDGFLKYGDKVSLQLSGGNPELVGAVLHADGFTDHKLRVQMYIGPPCQQRECLWEVVPQLMYEAAKMVAKAEEDSSNRPKRSRRNTRTVTAQEVRMELMMTKLREEQEANANLIESLGAAGDQRVYFKDTIQLRHVPSGKFLSMVPRESCELDPECIKVSLSAGSDACVFRVQPRYRIFSEGAPVAYGEQVTLCSTKLATHSLHVSTPAEDALMVQQKKDSHDALLRNQANLCLDLQGWRFFPYNECTPELRKDLLAGSVIELFHPEGDAYLSASSANFKRHPALIRYSGQRRPVKTLWIIEHARPLAGGVIPVNEGVRFKHVPSGRYLAIFKDAAGDSCSSAPGHSAEALHLSRQHSSPLKKRTSLHQRTFHRRFSTLTRSPQLPTTLISPSEIGPAEFEKATLFSLHPVSGEGDTIALTSSNTTETLRLQHVDTEFWLHNTVSSSDVAGSKAHSSQGAFKFVATRDRHDQDAFLLYLVPQKMLWEVEWLKSHARVLDRFVVALRMTVADAADHSSGSLRIDPELVKMVVCSLKDVIWACLEEPDTTTDPTKLSLDEGLMAVPKPQMQNLLRETKFLDTLVWAAVAPLSVDISGEMLHTPQLQGLLYISKLVYKLLTIGFLGSRRNEGYVASLLAEPLNVVPYQMTVRSTGVKMIEHTIMQVGDEVGAEDCLRALVSNNLELLESGVDQKTLARFVQLIADKGPKEIFMDFMTALCSCEGKQVISNQEDLLRIFLTPHRKNAEGDGRYHFSQPHFKRNRRELIIESVLDYSAPRAPFVSLSDQAWRKAHPGQKLDRGMFLGNDLWGKPDAHKYSWNNATDHVVFSD